MMKEIQVVISDTKLCYENVQHLKRAVLMAF